MTADARWLPEKLDVVGTGISPTSLQELLQLFEQTPDDRAMVVNLCNVHSVMSARSDAVLARAFERADINAPDGRPIVWALRSFGRSAQPQVRGTDLLRAALDVGQSRGWRHYFYGSTDERLEQLVHAIRETYPSVQIAGVHSPPFRPLSAEERAATVERIRAADPHFVWVGLGMPKQEKWMLDMRDELPGMILLGVGAAFDFLASPRLEAPAWAQRLGLEWALRFAAEPRRLWRRYVFNNPYFVVLWLRAIIEQKRR